MKWIHPSKRSRSRTVVRAVVAVRVAAVVVSNRVALKVVRQNHPLNLRVVTTMLNRRVKTRGAVVKGNRQGKGSADAARVNLLTRSNLEARQ
jgi:hypothetical protein